MTASFAFSFALNRRFDVVKQKKFFNGNSFKFLNAYISLVDFNLVIKFTIDLLTIHF